MNMMDDVLIPVPVAVALIDQLFKETADYTDWLIDKTNHDEVKCFLAGLFKSDKDKYAAIFGLWGRLLWPARQIAQRKLTIAEYNDIMRQCINTVMNPEEE